MRSITLVLLCIVHGQADRSDGAWSQGHIHSIADLTPVVAKCGLTHCEDNLLTFSIYQLKYGEVVTGVSREDYCPSDTSFTDILSPVPDHNPRVSLTITQQSNVNSKRVAVQCCWWLCQIPISTGTACIACVRVHLNNHHKTAM